MKFLWSDPGAAPPKALLGGASNHKSPQDTEGVGLTGETLFCGGVTTNSIMGQFENVQTQKEFNWILPNQSEFTGENKGRGLAVTSRTRRL